MSRRTYGGRNQSLTRGLLTFVMIAVLAVGAGYACTKYIITPYFIGDDKPEAGTSNQQETDFSGSSIITDQQDIEEPGEDTTQNSTETVADGDITANTGEAISLYCIQFGSFSLREGAETTQATLRASNIETSVILKDGSYKVIGTPYTNEEKAKEALSEMKAVAGEDIFITTMEAQLK